MKVYPDANIYVTYLLGQNGEALADRFFKQGIGCRFSIVASNTMFAEVAQRCGGRGTMLLQKNIEDFKKTGKFDIVNYTPGDIEDAYNTVMKMGLTVGRNDILHSILSRKHADIFVTDDKDLAKFASKAQKVMKLAEFVESEP